MKAIKVAFLAFAPCSYDADLLDLPAAHALIAQAAGEANVVVVYMHAGASLVIASGPHVLRGMQFYTHHLIAYSMGNFASYGDFAAEGDFDMSVILHVTLSSAGRFKQARIYPIQFIGQGQPVPGGGAIGFTARLSSEDFGASAARILPSGVVRAP